MRPLPLLLIFLMVTACASPSREFAGGARSDVQVAGLDFTVYHSDDRAQAYRRTVAWGLDPARVMVAGALAMEQASGCTVKDGSLKGDIALMSATILC